MTPTGYEHHIIRTLRREADYYSALVGLQHIASDPYTVGYDHVQVIPGNRVDHVTPAFCGPVATSAAPERHTQYTG